MAYSNNQNITAQNSEGSTIPPKGATGRYRFTDSRVWNSNQIADEGCYPGQLFIVRETLKLFFELYDPRLIGVDGNFFKPHILIGSWQILSQPDSHVLSSGKITNLVTTLSKDHIFSNGYKLADGFTDYGRAKIFPCNFELSPVASAGQSQGQGNNSQPRYKFPSQSTPVLRAEFSSDRAYQIASRQFKLELSNVGLHINQGAALVSTSYFVRQVNNIPGESYPFTEPSCQ
jgi:hypothetical protein